ncbi:MAG: hypothetical protein PHQ96_01920 [Candidatus Omnitrophica bacterium]|nr:hypothetical protein [Candidatus Omnitrophota bacterium]
MKKLIAFFMAVIFLYSFTAYPLGRTLFQIRNGVFEESKQVQSLLPNSKDAGLLVSMWDSCIITVTQLNAYFYMLGIFEKIDNNLLTDEPLNYLESWLTEIKKTSDMNLKSLDSYSQPITQETRIHKEKLREYLADLNRQIDVELGKVATIKKSLRVRVTR